MLRNKEVSYTSKVNRNCEGQLKWAASMSSVNGVNGIRICSSGSESDKINEHLGAHNGVIGTGVHIQRTWGWVMYIVSKEEVGNL